MIWTRGSRRRSFVMGRRMNDAEAHLRSRLPSRKSLVRFLLILIASWGVLSTTSVAVFILPKDPDPDHRAIIKMAIGLILVWCVLGGIGMYVLRDLFVRWATRIPIGCEPGLCCSASPSPWRKRR